MQKNWCFIFIAILLVGLVSAIDTSSIDQQLGSVDERVENITNQAETVKTTITNQDVRDAYLKKKFASVIENVTGIKQVVSAYRKISPYSDPIFKYIVGMAPELSLFFILVLVIWFFLVKYFFTIYEILRDFSTFSNEVSLIISSLMFTIFIAIKFFQNITMFLANKLVDLTEFLTSPIMKIAAFVVFVVGIIFLSKFSKEVRVIVEKIRESKEKMRRVQEEAELLSRQRGAVRVVERYAKAVNEED